MRKYLFLLLAFVFISCGAIKPKSTDAQMMNTAQVNFTYQDKIYFVYSTYVGTFCSNEWYKVLNQIPIKTKINETRKCDFKNYFIIQIFEDDKISAISINKKLFSYKIIKEANILSSLPLQGSQNTYLITTDPLKGAVAKIEILLESGQFVSLNQQILSKSLFFHQADLDK